MVDRAQFRHNPMEAWIKGVVGDTVPGRLRREALERYQLRQLNATLRHAVQGSPAYREWLADLGDRPLTGLEELEELPLMDQGMLRDRGEEMVCLPARDIKRIVTLDTSGSGGPPKRVWFTESDQELTVDFFHHGMQNVVLREDRVAVCMPYETEGSVGDLLIKGLRRLGTAVWGVGFLSEPAAFPEVAALMERERITAAVGTPRQMARLAEMFRGRDSAMKRVLLSAEYVDPAVVRRVEEAWGCRVFEHYGMTEMGLGGAVSCRMRQGYHIRENDLLVEIIDPDSGRRLPDGEWGEVVFTTLTRRGMPFIRYRTGDRSRILAEPCGCGSCLKRLDRVQDRGVPKNYERW